MNNIKKLYEQILPFNGFDLDPSKSIIEDNQYYYTLSPKKGKGYFWNYYYKNMFLIQKQNFIFFEDFFLECPAPDFLSIQYYTSVSGEEFIPYRPLSPHSLCVHIGGKHKKFQALYHKDIPIHSVSINIMPDFYNNYLHDKFGCEYINPKNAFEHITLVRNFPKLITLLNQIQTYKGSGISAKMFYEGKVLESLALIMEKMKSNQNKKQKIYVSQNDKEVLNKVADYIDNNYQFKISLENLSKIALMGTTKLKTNFKEYFGCNISDYIIQKRIGHAQHLLVETELTISEIAKSVGYERSDSFSRQFQHLTGMLPREYRNNIRN